MRLISFFLIGFITQGIQAQHMWSLENEVDLKLTQSECNEAALSIKTEGNVIIEGGVVNAILATKFNCAHVATNHTIRFSEIGITLNVDRESPSGSIVACNCKRILNFTFDSKLISEYVDGRIFFAIDGAVVEETMLPNK